MGGTIDSSLVADELGITAGLECFTTGDLGSCGETALNVALMFVGGLPTKLAAKYGLRWGKAAELGRRISALGGGLIDGIKGLNKANKKMQNVSCPIGNSFVPGTGVVMADEFTKPIEDVDTGEKVLATDPETGEQSARMVLATIVGSGTKSLVQITIDPTTGHPFWVSDLRLWVDAIDLTPGMWLQTSSGTWVQVSAVQAWTQATTVHNLTVQGVHTYHVGAGSLDVLNHNCGGAGSSKNPLDGTTYTDKVKGQIEKGDDHAFPALIDAMPTMDDTSRVVGRDGIERLHVRLPGKVNGKDGTFHWIVESDMTINHRFFGRRMK